VLRVERDEVDEDVHAVRQSRAKGVGVGPVQLDVACPLRDLDGPLAAAGDDDVPAGLDQPLRQDASGLAGAAEEKCSPRHAARRYHLDIEISRQPLFVRLPAAEAQKLSRASVELGRPKQDLVAEALRALELPGEGFGFGRHVGSPEVLTAEQLAELLQVDAKTVRSLAARGELPGRKLGREWRFSRRAVFDWLAGD
jgi:excisionase family DNA binding protein